MPHAPETSVMPFRTQLLWLLPILLLWAALRLAFGTSFSGNDDMAVARCALAINEAGLTLPIDHYCARFGINLPLAAIFRLFGTGATQISLLPALASLASLLLAWRLGTRLLGAAVGLAAAFALAVMPMDVEMAGIFFPDMMQGALMAAAVLGLLTNKDGRPAAPILAGLAWGWAYYVKVDAGVLVLVIGLGWVLGLIALRAAIIAGLIALALVAVEMVIYGIQAGDPLLQLHLLSKGTNEILAAGHDYRQILILPKTMFLVPYEAGLFFYAWLFGLGVALLSRSRAALFVAAWSLLWLLWLMFGADPFSGFRSKPQLPRYLLSLVVPAALVAGYGWVWLWQHLRAPALAIPVGMLAAIGLFGPFNQLTYEAPAATRRAVLAAIENGWFPLCPDVQSKQFAQLLLNGRREGALTCTVQEHDFLKGETRFSPPPTTPAYFLINEDYARRLQVRNLVRPIEPDRFGDTAMAVWRVDNPMPDLSYKVLGLLQRLTAAVPIPGFSGSIQKTAAEISRGSDALIWRVDGTPRAP